MQENIKDIKQELFHADGSKEDTEDANNPQDILSNKKRETNLHGVQTILVFR